MSDIVIRLHPFEIFGGSIVEKEYQFDFVIDGKKVTCLDDVIWCCLPDILLDGDSRKFIGLSFSIIDDYVSFVKQMVNTVSDRRCRFISNLEADFDSRYQGFGSNGRLELYWDDPNSEVNCEFASLYSGCWLYVNLDAEKKSTAWPIGYWLSGE